MRHLFWIHMKWSEVVAVWQTLRSISSQAGLQLLNVLVVLTLSQSSFNYDTDHERVWRTLGDCMTLWPYTLLWNVLNLKKSFRSKMLTLKWGKLSSMNMCVISQWKFVSNEIGHYTVSPNEKKYFLASPMKLNIMSSIDNSQQ